MDQGIGDQKSHYGFSALEKEEVWDRYARDDLMRLVRDAWGLPAPWRTSDWRRPNELARTQFMIEKMEAIFTLRRSGPYPTSFTPCTSGSLSNNAAIARSSSHSNSSIHFLRVCWSCAPAVSSSLLLTLESLNAPRFAAADLVRCATNSILAYGTHSLRRTKATQIYRRTGNLRAVQLLLGHMRIESTVRCLGVEVEDALAMAEQVEV